MYICINSRDLRGSRLHLGEGRSHHRPPAVGPYGCLAEDLHNTGETASDERLARAKGSHDIQRASGQRRYGAAAASSALSRRFK